MHTDAIAFVAEITLASATVLFEALNALQYLVHKQSGQKPVIKPAIEPCAEINWRLEASELEYDGNNRRLKLLSLEAGSL